MDERQPIDLEMATLPDVMQLFERREDEVMIVRFSKNDKGGYEAEYHCTTTLNNKLPTVAALLAGIAEELRQRRL